MRSTGRDQWADSRLRVNSGAVLCRSVGDAISIFYCEALSSNKRMSKSLLIGAVRKVIPDMGSDVAKSIVESVLDTISAELVSQGVFSLQKIGSLTLQQKPGRWQEQSSSGEQGDSPSRVPGVSARYNVSRFLADKLRDAHRASGTNADSSQVAGPVA